jgi:alpha-tubulin suppressor-like RCC1 family protein
MGDGTVTDRLSPVREICSATNWCQASAGYRLTTAIKTLGELWTWGFNLYGGLGDGTVTSRCSPVREICSATNWCQASAGRTRISALKTSGEIWSWGYNRCGQLGDGTQTDRCSPVREICSATDWCQLNSNNHNFVVAIKTSGELWAWGTGTQGELGDGTQTNKCSPVREISSATDWCQAGAGRLHAVAVKTSGQLWVWGGGSCGRLGNGTISNRCSPVREFSCSTDWTQVSAGEYNTMAIKSVTKGFLE